MSMTDEAAELIAAKTTDKYGNAGRFGVVIYTDNDSGDNLSWTFVRSENLNSDKIAMGHYAAALILELERMFGKDTAKLVKSVLKERRDGTKH